jgi:cupin superfamily acireductone dioxygenase involved in methionine salvage
MSEITYGPKGTQIIVVEGAKQDEEGNLVEGSTVDAVYYLGYQDANGTFFLWNVPANEISNVTDIDEGLQRGALKQEILTTLPNTKVSLTKFNNLSISEQIVSAGSYTELRTDIEDLTPVQSFIEDMNTIADELYWWKDSDYVNIVQENFAETGSYELNPAQMAEFLTKYNLSKEEYNGAIERATNPIGYKDKKAQYYDTIKSDAQKLGGVISDKGAMYLAEKWASGKYTPTKVAQQLNAALDDYSPFTIDTGFENALGDVTKVSTNETKVQQLLDTYVPKHLHTRFNIAEEAGNLRNKGGYETKLIEKMKDVRFAQYGMYDRDIAWQNIVNNYVSQASNVWGVQASEDDPAILDAVRANNQTEAIQKFRQIGLDRGYQATVNSFASDMADAFGTGVVKSAGYLEG